MSRALRDQDRRFFALVSEAAFANPFGARRSQLDAEIGEQPVETADWQEGTLQRVGARLQALSADAKLDVRAFSSADRELVEHTLLFESFHRFAPELDRLIAAQARRRDAPLHVELAGAFLRELVGHGIEDARAVRLLELFYQMRRAYYFVSSELTGRSPSMRKLRESLWAAVFTSDLRRYERHLWNRMEDFSTIFVGETGTGKGAAAAAIGRSGFIPFDAKKNAFAYGFHESFVPIHLNEFPETLFESEIFGHRKGAFTGAVEHYEGALARCRPFGTVFFDEIGEATLQVQVKLLRVLQERVYTPVGSREPQHFHGRILAATHRSLDELRAEGMMRDDFFYRLCSNVIEVPPLRVRLAESEDALAELVAHLCARITSAANAELAAELTQTIARDLGPGYAFPGNVRELEQCVRRVLLTGGCAKDAAAMRHDARSLAVELEAGVLSADALLGRYCALLYDRSGSYVEVARITGLDRRTVKKQVESAARST
ncbi:MAG: sigma-54-dependent transcriptional regulator [Polyangiales bacterium]